MINIIVGVETPTYKLYSHFQIYPSGYTHIENSKIFFVQMFILNINLQGEFNANKLGIF